MVSTPPKAQQRELRIEFLAQLLSGVHEEGGCLLPFEVRAPVREGRVNLDLSEGCGHRRLETSPANDTDNR